jgi:hypothetical protein
MMKDPAGSIGIDAHQNEAFCPFRHPRPSQWRRGIVAVASMSLRYRGARLESGAFQDQWHVTLHLTGSVLALCCLSMMGQESWSAMTGINAQRAPLTGVKAPHGRARDRSSLLREGQFKASGVSP